MTADPLSQHSNPPAVEKLLDQFEGAWRRGTPPEIADFMRMAAEQSFDRDSRRALVVELVLIDLWHRWRRAASKKAPAEKLVPSVGGQEQETAMTILPERPWLEDYVRSYPELGPLEELPLFVIGEEYWMRHRCGDHPEHAVYLKRFADKAVELERLLSKIDRQLSGDTVRTGEETAPDVPAVKPKVPERKEEEPFKTPETIGKYRIINVLDEGGQAMVYRAVHPALAKELVIKLARYPLRTGEAATDHLAAEAKMLAELDHPNLGRVLDLDVYQGRPYFVMEYIRGLNLRQYTEQHPLAPAEIAVLIAKIARAVAVAHAKGVVHQDIKPKNIMIDESGQPRVIDFGLARLQHAWTESRGEPGMISGTIQFMAPEQARGDNDQVSYRSDIFALGAVLYSLLVGKAPFAAEDVYESHDRACRCVFDANALEKAGVPAGLREVCLRAMKADPAERYASAEDMAADLAIVAAIGIWWGTRGHEPPPPPLSRPLRQDFAIQFAPLGATAETPAKLTLTEGQRVAFRFQADRDCYVGVWCVDSNGDIVQLFPNQDDSDHFVEAGRPRTIPGERSYGMNAVVSQGPEYLHVVASTAPWKAEAGAKHGSYVVFASPEERKQWEERVRGIVLKKEDSPAVSELVLPFEVRPKQR
jgi:serine/threonine protein kinase